MLSVDARRRGLVLVSGRRRWFALLVGASLVVWSVWERVDIAIALVVLGPLFTLLERWRPLRRQRAAIRRTGSATDAASFVVNEVLAAVGLAAVLVVAVPVVRWVVPGPISRSLVGQPGWTRWCEAFVVSEVGGYWGHRLSHQIPAL
jgi:sterol desaturase/sphingolipid hydroxylase (fatty acid hydroxylase superfamily)